MTNLGQQLEAAIDQAISTKDHAETYGGLTVCDCLDLAHKLEPNFRYEPVDEDQFKLVFQDGSHIILQRD